MSLFDALQQAGLIDVPADAPRPVPFFEDADQEYQAAWKSAAIVVEHGFGMLSVTGEDRAKFLHNFCTNDIQKMQPGDVCEAFFCNVKGRIVALGIILCRPEQFLILTDESRVASLHQHLDRYVIAEDVTLAIPDQEEPLLVIGNEDNLKRIEAPSGIDVFPWDNGFRPARWLIGPPDALVEAVQQCVSDGGVIAGQNAWEVFRISAAYPRYGVDISDENLAQEANRTERAISFTKGCYLGQEPIARLDAMGHVNRELEWFCYEDSGSPPAAGSPVVTDTGEEVGTVTSACELPNNGGLGDGNGMVLAMLKVTSKQAEELIARTDDGQPVILEK